MTECNKQKRREGGREGGKCMGVRMHFLDDAVVERRAASHYVELPNECLGALVLIE